MTYRVRRKRIVRSRSHPEGREVYTPDDVIEPTDEELRSFGDRLEEIEDDEEDEEEASEEDEESEDFDEESWLDQHYSDRADKVTKGKVDKHLDRIEGAETSTQVLDAIEERRDMPEFGTAFDDESEEDDEDEEESEE